MAAGPLAGEAVRRGWIVVTYKNTKNAIHVIVINDATNQVCTHLEVRDIAPVTAAHIEHGRAPSLAGLADVLPQS